MKRFILVMLFPICLTANGQYVSPNEVITINDLYVEEQYDAFLDKISNLGFKLKTTVKDYTLKDVNYKSECSFEKLDKAPYDKNQTEYSNSLNYNRSVWAFKIEEHPLYKKYKITMLIYATNAKDLFNHLYHHWTTGDKAVESYSSSEYVKGLYTYETNYGIDLESGDVYEIPNRLYVQTLEYSTVTFGGIDNVRVFLEYNLAKLPLNQPIDDYLKDREERNKQSIVSIPITNEGKVSKVNVNLSGKNIIYIIDSGASDMNINSSTEKYLKEIGVIRSSDYLEPAKYQLADGTIKEYRRVLLSLVRIGEVSVESVVANISEDNEMLLLGKSFLNKFAYWKINNQNQTLELKKK